MKKTDKKIGRPTKCTPETVDKILGAVRRGHYVETATRLARITDQTFYSWKERGESGEEPFAAFLDALKVAEAEAEDSALLDVRAGATGTESNPGTHWVSAMTFLERRWPARWGRRDPERSELDRRLKGLEIELTEAKLAALKSQTGTGIGEPVADDAIDKMMSERFGGVRVYPFAEGEQKH